MSGGHYDYNQYKISQIKDELEQDILRCESTNEEDAYYNFSKETVDEFKKGLEYLKLAEIYTQRIDWLLSRDDGEQTFHKRLKEDLSKEGLKYE